MKKRDSDWFENITEYREYKKKRRKWKAEKRKKNDANIIQRMIDEARKKTIVGHVFRGRGRTEGGHVSGRVLSRLSEDTFEVFFYCWFPNQTTDTVQVKVSDMRSWTFINSTPVTTVSQQEICWQKEDRQRVERSINGKVEL